MLDPSSKKRKRGGDDDDDEAHEIRLPEAKSGKNVNVCRGSGLGSQPLFCKPSPSAYSHSDFEVHCVVPVLLRSFRTQCKVLVLPELPGPFIKSHCASGINQHRSLWQMRMPPEKLMTVIDCVLVRLVVLSGGRLFVLQAVALERVVEDADGDVVEDDDEDVVEDDEEEDNEDEEEEDEEEEDDEEEEEEEEVAAVVPPAKGRGIAKLSGAKAGAKAAPAPAQKPGAKSSGKPTSKPSAKKSKSKPQDDGVDWQDLF